MLNLIISRSGYGKTYEIHNKIKQLVEQGNKEIFLIIPEQVSFETEKEILQKLGAKKADSVKVMSFTKLCRLFFEKYGGRTKPYIDSTGKTALMEIALKQISSTLSLFKRQAQNPEFCETMIDLSQKIKRYSVSVDELSVAAEKSNGILKEKLFETTLILSSYENLLNKEYFDPLDNLTVVGEMLNENYFFKNKYVFVDAFTGFTLQQIKIIENIIKTAKETYISLGFDGIYAKSEFSTFANMAKTALNLKEIAKNNNIENAEDILLLNSNRFKSDELVHLEQNIYAPDLLVYQEQPKSIKISVANNIFEEADYVAKTIHNLIRTTKIRFRDIAVISRDAAEYNGIIDEAFSRYDIPCFIDDREGVENLALFRFINFALQAILTNYSSENIISLLKTGLTDFTDDEISLFEVYINVWDINKADFEKEFVGSTDVFFDGSEQECADLLILINKIRADIISKLSELKKSFNNNASQMSKALYDFITKSNVAKHLKKLSDELNNKGLVRLSETTIRSYDIFINVIDQLYLSLNNTELSTKRYYELFSSAISLLDVGSLPQGLDEVAVGSAERMRPKSPKATFIIGANEGVFPSSKSGSGLFSDDELQKLKDNGIALPFYDVDTAIDEQYLAYSSVCSASSMLFVSYCSSSLTGEEKEPSSIVTEIKAIFPNLKVEKCDVTQIENVDTALKILATQNNYLSKSIEKYFEKNNNRGYLSIKNALNKEMPTLSPEIAQRLYGENIHTSASKIDVFHKCHFYYFCKYGLKANVIRPAKIDSLERGSLVHFILEKAVTNFSPKEFIEKTYDNILAIVKKLTEEYLFNILNVKKQTPVEKYRLNELCKMISDLLQRVFAELSQTEFEVFKPELKIGGENKDISAYTLEFQSGKKIYLSGMIDRVDICSKNGKKYVRIIDYKTGAKMLSLSDILIGQNLQMFVYMIALIKNGKELLGEVEPSGIFYYPAKDSVLSTDDRHIDDDNLKSERTKQVKMNGILLDDEQSYTAIEPDGLGIFSPVKITKGGTLSKSVNAYTLEQYGLIARHIDKIISQMGNSLLQGNIDINPTNGSSNACDYCDYHSVCFFNGDATQCNSYKNEEVFEILEKEEQK